MLTPMDLRRSWPTLGLVVLLVLDLVLVVWALWPSSRTAASTAPLVTATASLTPSSSASPSATASSAADPVRPSPLTRLVVPVGRSAVWAVDAGTCKAPGAVHVSDDGGKTWSSHPAAGSVTRVRPDGPSSAFVVGGTRTCQSRLWTTSDGGRTWNGPRSAAAAWGRSPKDARLVLRPSGAPVTPCPGRARVLDLVALNRFDASALCDDGTLRRTTNGGDAWSTGLTVRSGLALALSSPDTGVVASLARDCDGVVVGVLTTAGLGPSICVAGVRPAAGEVALGVASSGVWLTAGDAVLRAPGPGGAFTRVSGWPTG